MKGENEMKLYDLIENVTLQGNIEVKQLLVNGDTRRSLFFECVEQLRSADLNGMEELEVTYIYAETFEQKNWNYTRTRPLMVIEVEQED